MDQGVKEVVLSLPGQAPQQASQPLVARGYRTEQRAVYKHRVPTDLAQSSQELARGHATAEEVSHPDALIAQAVSEFIDLGCTRMHAK